MDRWIAPAGFSPAFNLSSGFPAYPAPPIFDPTIRNNQSVGYITPGFGKPAMIQSWSFQIQQQLATDLIMSIGYVGNKSQNLRGTSDPKIRKRAAPAVLLRFGQPQPGWDDCFRFNPTLGQSVFNPATHQSGYNPLTTPYLNNAYLTDPNTDPNAPIVFGQLSRGNRVPHAVVRQ